MAQSGFDVFRFSERMMSMDDETWSRHANPWSVYSRFSVLPLLTLAIWSRVWLGWGALVPVALVLAWTWYNPRAFAHPASTGSWAARGTFGERVFLNRHALPVPGHHVRWARGLALASAAGLVPWIIGVWRLDLSATLLGLTLMIGGKVWFVDRMVWLYQDMREADPAYSRWLRPDPGQKSKLANTGA